MKSLVLLVDESAPSFCYYPSPEVSGGATMSRSVFEAALEYARANDLPLQLVCGADGLPTELQRALGDYPAVCYAPAGACSGPDDVPVIEASAPQVIDSLPVGHHPIAVLRVAREEVPRFPQVWRALAERVNRVVVVLADLEEELDEQSLDAYTQALGAIRLELEAAYLSGEDAELNIISDRMVLQSPRQCNAGIDHVTVSPSGQLYLCPGFARDGALPLGMVGEEPVIANRHLLTLERAPICSVCDAYQCRRCVYLNQRCTLELNTPPSQLCRTAHREREAARQLVEDLHARDVLTNLRPIEPIDYDDPLELLLAEKDSPQPSARRGRPLPPKRNGSPTAHCVVGATQARQNGAVGRVTKEERDAIRQLHIRRRGLSELFATLCKMDSETLEATPLYGRITEDMGAVTLEFQAWWDAMAEKYGWVPVDGRNWTIDFATCEIRLE